MTSQGRRPKLSTRVRALSSLLFQFLLQIVLSGIGTARIIVRPGVRPRPGLVRMRFDDLSETGAAVLACMVTLTPGSTVLDVDMDEQELLLHLLDASHPEDTVLQIRETFERRLQLLLPAAPRPAASRNS